jgi:hypothetical protein
MRNLFHRILSALNINGRDWVVLLPALLLAFSIWLIHNLSLKYNDYFSVHVVAECNIPGHSGESANRCEVSARGRATGYKLIKSHLFKRKAHNVTFRQTDMKHYDGDMFYITSTDLQSYSHLIFDAGVSVEYFLSDTLFFRFPYENFKKVRVVPTSVVSYKEQCMADGPLQVEPDSILVYAEPYQLERVNEVYTRPIHFTDLSEDVTGLVGLEKIKDVRFSVDEVRYSLKVKRFVEIEQTLPVKVKNVPGDKMLRVFPSEAIVRIRCNFPLTEDPLRGLSLVADYEDFVSSISGKCPLRLTGISRSVISHTIEPAYVSGLMENLR